MKNSVIILFLLLLFNGCIGSKKISETTTKQTETSVIDNDSTSVEVVNQKINDQATISVPDSKTGDAEFDKRVNEAVANILRSINFQKSSGDNSYRLYYDEQLKQLKAQIEIGETKDLSTEVTNESSSEKSFESQVDEYIKKIVIPWWVYVLGAIFIWPYIKPIVMMLLGPTSLISSFSSLTKPKE
jgi:hypothetical protein